MAIEIVDGLVLLLYLAGIVFVGFYASRRIHSSGDYAVAGRSIGFPLLSGTLIGTTIGAAATMGNAGKAYSAGYPVLYVSVAYILGYAVLSLFATRLRAHRIESLPDILQRRYGPAMRLCAGVVLLFAAVPVVALQLIACGLIVTRFFPELGLDFSTAVTLAALVIVVYTLLGGLLAVAYTDLLQVLIMVLGIGLLLPLIVGLELGSLEAIREAATSPTSGWLGGMDPVYVLSFFPVFTAMVLIDPGVWQRIAAAKRAEDLRPALLLTAGFYGVWSLLVVSLGVVASKLYPELEQADLAIPKMVVDYMPVVIRGLCIAAIIALIMSTADSMLLICGTTVSWDILRVLRPATADARLLMVSRLVILVVGIAAVMFSLLRISLFEINFLALGVFVSGLFVPVMGALFYRRATTPGAIAGTLAGAGVMVCMQLGKLLYDIEPPVQPILAGLGASALGFFALSHVTWRARQGTAPILKSAS